MRLSDIMSSAGLAFYPQIALFIFLIVFTLVCLRILRPSHAAQYQSHSTLPLDDAPRANSARRHRSTTP
jgi:cbb3-type cytochrome oxidase subunit 3